MKRSINFYELLWTMFLYLLMTDFSWLFLIFVVLTCPVWVYLYDAGAAYKDTNKTLDEVGMNRDGSIIDNDNE